VDHTLGVMPGLDPGIRDNSPRMGTYVRSSLRNRVMDCRVKPGNDSNEVCNASKWPGNAQPSVFGISVVMPREGGASRHRRRIGTS